MHRRFAPCSLAHVKNQFPLVLLLQQAERTTGDELEFIVQDKINRLFEYSNDKGKFFKQLSTYRPLVGGKNTLVSI